MNSLKKPYNGLKFTLVAYECENSMLAGSKTSIKININEVQVNDFANGFESETGGFKEISFD